MVSILDDFTDKISSNGYKFCKNTLVGDIYLGRAFYSKQWKAAKIIPTKGIFISHKGKEIQLPGFTRIQKLINDNFRWEEFSDGNSFPKNAVPLDLIQRTYIGRIVYFTNLQLGQIKNGILYFGYHGFEHKVFGNYEVLIYKSSTRINWEDVSFLEYMFP